MLFGWSNSLQCNSSPGTFGMTYIHSIEQRNPKGTDMNAYAVKHKETGLFFSGFDRNDMPTWGSEKDARQFDKSGTTQQALLFARFGIAAQKKPVLDRKSVV